MLNPPRYSPDLLVDRATCPSTCCLCASIPVVEMAGFDNRFSDPPVPARLNGVFVERPASRCWDRFRRTSARRATSPRSGSSGPTAAISSGIHAPRASLRLWCPASAMTLRMFGNNGPKPPSNRAAALRSEMSAGSTLHAMSSPKVSPTTRSLH